MVRNYKRKPGARRYKDYTEEHLLNALQECQLTPVATVAKVFKIPRRTLINKLKEKHIKRAGHPVVFSVDEEEVITKHVEVCADYGIPLEAMDIQLIVHGYLNKIERNVSAFKNNVPGPDWVASFLKRNPTLSTRMCQNIKRSRAKVTPEEIKIYFQHLEKSLENVPKENIMNYDETNLSDQPGTKKCIFRRGVKYPERIINFSKGNISIMFAGTAGGQLLPPYVVYKASHLWDSWMEGGPRDARYSKSISGWMDSINFEEWFRSVVVPWARRIEGKKVLIGDNLSSHLSYNVIDMCEKYDIGFVLLPPNSTDKLQPLDVSYFGPMKRAWRKIMTDYKMNNPNSTSLDKSDFPRLLSKLITDLEMKTMDNLVSGFRTCGIFPVNANEALKKFPQEKDVSSCDSSLVSESFEEYLHNFKFTPSGNKTRRKAKKKVNVIPGKSLCADDLKSNSTAKSSVDCTQEPIVSDIVQPSTSAEGEASTSTAAQGPSSPAAASNTSSDDIISDNSVVYDDSDDDWEPPAKKKSRNIFKDF